MTDVIYANIVPFGTGYKFRITDPVNPMNTQELERPLREFRMNLVTAFTVQYGKTYNVEVAIKNTDGSYLPYGSACTVTTPVFPTVALQEAQCDNYQVPANSTQIYATSYPGAIGYAFQLSGSGLASPVEVIKPTRAFTLNDFSGLAAGATYNVRVRLIFSNNSSVVYGKVCTIITPGLSKQTAITSNAAFNAVAYPNPFADGFHLDITASAKGNVNVKVYDMTGRLLDNQRLGSADMKSFNIGESYPSGVYNVIVSQGENIQTLRVVKR